MVSSIRVALSSRPASKELTATGHTKEFRMGISPPQAHLAPPDHGIAARASAEEFERAVRACDFAVLVWELPDGVVALANDAASTLFNTSLPELLGTKNVDLLGPRGAVEVSFAALSSRAVENLRAQRH